MKTTFKSFAFGCRVNQAEQEKLDSDLMNLGWRLTPNNPDFFIINTCAVTNKAEREARQLIYQTKRKNPQTLLVVTGCAATKWIKEGKKVEGVDLAIDNVNKEYLANYLAKNIIGNIPSNKVKERRNSTVNNIYYHLNGRLGNTLYSRSKLLDSGRLLLKIQDGCQRYCTFCIVPYLRGQPRSVSIKGLVSSIKGIEKNIKEVILTAINTQAFGFDTGQKLTDLIETILTETKIEKLSFGSIHPWSIDKEFLSLYKKLKDNMRFAKFLHIPLQSGSDKMLAYMKRGYTRGEFLEKLKTVESICPLTFMGTDIITGFLEETNEDFEETYDFLNKSPISKFHVFRFSKRDKTAAYFMAKRMEEPTPSEKSKRSKALIGLSTKKYQKFLAKHLEQSFPALILERKTENMHEALLFNQVPVLVRANKKDIAKIKTVKIVTQKDFTLVASIN